MKLGIIGLGKMGHAIAQRVMAGGHEVVAFDLDTQARQSVANLGGHAVQTIPEVASHARIIWLMVPAGPIVDAVIDQLLPGLRAGDIIIDGGNSKFTDSINRAQRLLHHGISFLDCGTSGGVHGLRNGFCLMVGGAAAAYQTVLPLLQVIAAPDALGLVGPSGAGHYVKMVHNGIEYGLMQAYAEGFHILKEGSFKDAHLDLYQITRIWNHGSVIRSWLLQLSEDIFKKDQQLTDIKGTVAQSGMGKWTVEEAHKHAIPVDCIEHSLQVRARSQKTGGNFATKVVALLRNAFGGHTVDTQ